MLLFRTGSPWHVTSCLNEASMILGSGEGQPCLKIHPYEGFFPCLCLEACVGERHSEGGNCNRVACSAMLKHRIVQYSPFHRFSDCLTPCLRASLSDFVATSVVTAFVVVGQQRPGERALLKTPLRVSDQAVLQQQAAR